MRSTRAKIGCANACSAGLFQRHSVPRVAACAPGSTDSSSTTRRGQPWRHRPRLHRRRRGLRVDQDARRPALRPDPAPRPAGAVGDGPRARRAGRGGGTPRSGRGPGRDRRPARPAAHHLHRRAGADGLRTRRRPAPPWSSPTRAIDPCRESTTVSTVPWPRNERGATAGLKTTSYAENVIALAHASERGGDRGDLRQHRRQPLRGHRLQRLLRRGRRAAHADPGQRLPGRRHPGARARVVRGWRSTSRWRGRPAAERGLPRLDHARRPGDQSWDDRELPAPGPVTAECARTWARPRGRAPRPLILEG